MAVGQADHSTSGPENVLFGSTIVPGGPTIAPGGPTIAPDEPTIVPDEPTIAPGEPTIVPDEPTNAPSGTPNARFATTIAFLGQPTPQTKPRNPYGRSTSTRSSVKSVIA